MPEGSTGPAFSRHCPGGARSFGAVLALAAGAACLLACGRSDQAAPPPAPPAPVRVVAARVSFGPILRATEITCTLTPRVRSVLASPGDGSVTRAFVDAGARVNRGEAILDIGRGPQAGGARGVTVTVRSPHAGTLLERFVSPGDRVRADPATLLAVVADLDLMRCRAPLSEEQGAELGTGQEATVSAAAFPGRLFAGRLNALMPPGDGGDGPREAELLIDNLQGELDPGTTVAATVVTKYRPRTLLVPAGAVREGRVRVVENGMIRVRPLQAGIRSPEMVEVLSGVFAGDLVVVACPEPLEEGTRVVYDEPPTTAPGAGGRR